MTQEIKTVPFTYEALSQLEMKEGILELQIGPAHAGSGHMRILAWVEGDTVVKVDPDVGFVHRGVEKLSEDRLYIKAIPMVERPSLVDTVNANLGYVIALERLLGLEPPPRAQYIRVITAEISRIMSHLYGIAIYGIFMGSSTVFMWAVADREPFIDLLQELTGARITYSHIIPGGVRWDLPKGFADKVEVALRYLENRMKDYEKVWINNPVVVARSAGVGKLGAEDAIRLGVVGPNLRASGVKYDVRKNDPYAAYADFDFEVPTFKEGDSYSRLLIRVEEIKQSMSIIRQALKRLPEGKVIYEDYYKRMSPLMKEIYDKTGRVKFTLMLTSLSPPKGEAISRVEGGRGEMFYYLVSDGGKNPYRFRLVTPSFRNLPYFTHVMPGHKLADIPVIYGSIDYFPPEADR
ncbi:MAG: NADH-quinone oxidoreductase subunit D [Thermoprotei archaeon]